MEKYYYHVQCMVFSVVCSFFNNFAKLVFSLVLYECKHKKTKSFVGSKSDPQADLDHTMPRKRSRGDNSSSSSSSECVLVRPTK